MILITGGSFQGKTEFAVMRFPERERIVHFEEQVRDWIREGLDPICQTERLVKEHPDSVVGIDEIGSGILPMNQEERIWREAVGRAGSCPGSGFASNEREEKVTFSPVFEPGRQRNPDHRSRKDRCSKSQSLASFWGQDPDMCAAE